MTEPDLQKTLQNPPRERITAKRQARIEKEFEVMARGIWTNADIAEHVGCSEATVKRDLQHPYALKYVQDLQERRGALVDQLIQRQINQIETGGVPPATQLYVRAKLIDKLLPSKIIQRIGGKVTGKVEVKIPELEAEELARYIGVIVKTAMDQEARDLRDDPNAEDSDKE